MSKEFKRLPAAFFLLSNGREPVREWLKELDIEDRRIIGHDIRDLEFSACVPLARRWLVGSAEHSDAPEDRTGHLLYL